MQTGVGTALMIRKHSMSLVYPGRLIIDFFNHIKAMSDEGYPESVEFC